MDGLVAFGAGRAALDAALRIPGDVYLAQFGDNLQPSRLGVPFLTANQSIYEVGKKAVRLIVDMIADVGSAATAYGGGAAIKIIIP